MIDTKALEERLFRFRHRQAFRTEPQPAQREKLRHYMIGDWRTSAANKRDARKKLRQALGNDFPMGLPVIEVVRIKGEWVPKNR